MLSTLRAQYRRVHAGLDARSDRAIAPMAAHYAAVLMCEDVIVNAVLGGQMPLALSTWRARTGLSELPPVACGRERHAWAARVRVDVSALRPYARAVYAATDAFFARRANLPPSPLSARVLWALLVNQRLLLESSGTHTVC